MRNQSKKWNRKVRHEAQTIWQRACVMLGLKLGKTGALDWLRTGESQRYAGLPRLWWHRLQHMVHLLSSFDIDDLQLTFLPACICICSQFWWPRAFIGAHTCRCFLRGWVGKWFSLWAVSLFLKCLVCWDILWQVTQKRLNFVFHYEAVHAMIEYKLLFPRNKPPLK